MTCGYIPDMDKGLFSKASKSTLEPAYPPDQWESGAFSPIVKGSGL
jgi:hypothetical protein